MRKTIDTAEAESSGEDTATEIVALSAGTPVVVFGSLPPAGRDLDVLVRKADLEPIRTALARRGFESQGRMWARFRDCGAEVVELAPAEDFGLRDAELDDLFTRSTAITGNLHRPSSEHALLILARRVVREGSSLREKRRRRIASELDRDPQAFERARRIAPGWGVGASLEMLETAYRDDAPLGHARRRAAIAVELSKAGRGSGGATLGSWRAILRRPRRGGVIALSGLDGSGKSTQARHLAAALDSLGRDTTTVWTSVAFQPAGLARAVRLAKRALRALPGSAPAGSPKQELDGAPRDSGDPVKQLRSGSSVLTFLWSSIVCVVLASQVLRRVWPEVARGRTVICDRYQTDALAHLRYQYGESRSFLLQRALLSAVFPRPAAAFLLEIDAETAARRKPEYDTAQNRRRARLYRAEAESRGVRPVDADAPLVAVCAELARASWRGLS